MTDPEPEINSAFDGARASERELRDQSINDDIETSERLARDLGKGDDTPR